jgi:transposase
MNRDIILAIDLGRYKSVVCISSYSVRRYEYRTVDSTPNDIRDLLAEYPGSTVVIEACANAGWVSDLALSLGHTVKVANTAGEAWKFTHLKRKTDRDDARKLADLEALGQLPTVVLPDPPTRQRRMLIAYRQDLVTKRVACQNRIRSLFAGVGLPTPLGAKAWSSIGLAGLELQSKPLTDCHSTDLWRGMLADALTEYRSLVARLNDIEVSLDKLSAADAATQLLQTIPGVGPRTAEAVAAHLGDPNRFASAKQVGAYAGLVPRQYQSGTTDRKGRITRRGPGLLRKLLVECGWVMLRYNRWARELYSRLTGGGASRKKPAIVAIALTLAEVCGQ